MSNDVALAYSRTSRLIEITAKRDRIKPEAALRVVAQNACVTPSVIERIKKKRRKTIPGWLRDRLGDLLVKEIQNEMARLQAELDVAKLTSSRPDDQTITQAQEAIETAKKLLEGRGR